MGAIERRLDAHLLQFPPAELNVVIGSLALGGAERIVLAWAASARLRHRVHLVVLRDAREEWPLVPGIEVTRLGGADILQRLEDLGATFAAGGNRVVLCHLLLAAERAALARGGALPIPVLHNASAGWLEPGDSLAAAPGLPFAIAVSQAAADELRTLAPALPCMVVRHLPRPRAVQPDARRRWRAHWALPQDALVIGMAGGVKPQKAYPRALRVLAALHALPGFSDVHLVVLGGPTGRDGMLAWQALLAQAHRLQLEPWVRLPGFVTDAAQCCPAFDLFLNTSRYEGLSMATLEALVAGLPVVASRVGGQGEVGAPGLTLLEFEDSNAHWAEAIAKSIGHRPKMPDWRGFPGDRLWTLCHLAEPFAPRGDARPGVLFVTANLNAGGAQRSLVNLALKLMAGRDSRIAFDLTVCGHSTAVEFTQALQAAGVPVHRSADSRDCFDHAEALLRQVRALRPAVLCFWNVDPKIKLLLVKMLGAGPLRFVDVSPGDYAFEEMRDTAAFQQCIAFTAAQYHARLSRLVLKYRPGAAHRDIAIRSKLRVIPNGVTFPARSRDCLRDADGAGRAIRHPRIVVSGRIAPSKFLLEIIAAMRLLWLRFPLAELHVLGTAEPRHADYAQALCHAAGEELGRRVHLHGAAFDAPERLAGFDLALVLGEHQGCPNAVLEALAAGVPVVANDSGGTREQVIDGRTGILLRDREPATIAAGLARVLADAALARRLSDRGRAHVAQRFSMSRMAGAYLDLFETVAKEPKP